VKIGLYVDGKRTDITVKPNEKTLAYEGTLTAPSIGTFTVTGVRLPQIWATTPDGLKQVTKKDPGASNPYKRNSPKRSRTSPLPTTAFPPQLAIR